MNLPKIWSMFSSAPHRMFFFGGAVQSILTLTWWLADLGGRYGGFYAPISWTISPTDAHAFLMIYSFFPFFIFGFLMTTYPVSYTHLRAHETDSYLVCRLLLE